MFIFFHLTSAWTSSFLKCSSLSVCLSLPRTNCTEKSEETEISSGPVFWCTSDMHMDISVDKGKSFTTGFSQPWISYFICGIEVLWVQSFNWNCVMTGESSPVKATSQSTLFDSASELKWICVTTHHKVCHTPLFGGSSTENAKLLLLLVLFANLSIPNRPLCQIVSSRYSSLYLCSSWWEKQYPGFVPLLSMCGAATANPPL